jgi:hypothetical protein
VFYFLRDNGPKHESVGPYTYEMSWWVEHELKKALCHRSSLSINEFFNHCAKAYIEGKIKINKPMHNRWIFIPF